MNKRQQIRVLTYNIHKGFRAGGKHFVLHEIRELIRSTGVDMVFLQEVVGENTWRASRTKNWPEVSQYEFLADAVWGDFKYGKNAVYERGHHGNAILSRFPVDSWENIDISTNKREQRGLLHTCVTLPGKEFFFHACCTHLDLTKRGQKRQVKHLSQWLTNKIQPNEPLILAGDFNDWTNHASSALEKSLSLTEAVQASHGKLKATFPAAFPVLRLDRIYTRGFKVLDAAVLKEKVWRKLSDHVPVAATLECENLE